MNYVELINKLNNELESNGVNTIYTLIANNIDINVIKELMETNTTEYHKLSDKEKSDLVVYIKGLSLQSKLILSF